VKNKFLFEVCPENESDVMMRIVSGIFVVVAISLLISCNQQPRVTTYPVALETYVAARQTPENITGSTLRVVPIGIRTDGIRNEFGLYTFAIDFLIVGSRQLASGYAVDLRIAGYADPLSLLTLSDENNRTVSPVSMTREAKRKYGAIPTISWEFRPIFIADSTASLEGRAIVMDTVAIYTRRFPSEGIYTVELKPDGFVDLLPSEAKQEGIEFNDLVYRFPIEHIALVKSGE